MSDPLCLPSLFLFCVGTSTIRNRLPQKASWCWQVAAKATLSASASPMAGPVDRLPHQPTISHLRWRRLTASTSSSSSPRLTGPSGCVSVTPLSIDRSTYRKWSKWPMYAGDHQLYAAMTYFQCGCACWYVIDFYSSWNDWRLSAFWSSSSRWQLNFRCAIYFFLEPSWCLL